MLNSPLAHPTRGQLAERLIWMLLLGSSVLYFFWTNEADNDLWGHVFFGRQILAMRGIPRLDTLAYTTTGGPWVDHEWLSQVMMAALYGWMGPAGLVIAKFVVAAGAFALVLMRLRRRATQPGIWGITALFAVAAMARGFGIRPQVLTYLFVALVLLLLDDYQRGRRGALWCVPAVFLPWANLHGGFVLGLGILGLFACADLLSQNRSPRPWIVLLASTAVIALNPYGPRLLLYVWNELSRAHPITEWQPASFGAEHLAFYGMFALFLASLPFGRGWRRRGWEVLLALGIGVLAVRHQRHTPVFALCAAAPLAAQLGNARRWVARRSAISFSSASRRLLGAAIVALAATQLWLTVLHYRRYGAQIFFDPREYPVDAVRALRQSGASGNIAVPLDWGEYVLWFLAPQVKVSLDGRFATVFPERVVQDNFNFFLGAPGWHRLLDDYPTQAALVPAGSPCPVRSLPDWRLVYRDRQAELYVKAGSAQAMGLESAPLQPGSEQVPVGIFP
jgi:hypothetical protein